MEMELPLLYELIAAKEKLIEQKEKLRKEYEAKNVKN